LRAEQLIALKLLEGFDLKLSGSCANPSVICPHLEWTIQSTVSQSYTKNEKIAKTVASSRPLGTRVARATTTAMAVTPNHNEVRFRQDSPGVKGVSSAEELERETPVQAQADKRRAPHRPPRWLAFRCVWRLESYFPCGFCSCLGSPEASNAIESNHSPCKFLPLRDR
jgi:hypothetical protein